MHEESRRHVAITGVVFVLAGLGCTLALEQSGLLAGLSRSLLDTMPRTMTSTPSDRIAIVAINDEDYAEPRFHKTSPLAPQGVAEIINAIQTFAPRMIGVDLETSDWPHANLPSILQLPGRVVWARTFIPDPGDPQLIQSLNPVLGGDGAGVCYGLTAMQPDSDYVIRTYPSGFRLGAKWYVAFPEIVHELQSEPQCVPVRDKLIAETTGNEPGLLIRFRGEGHEIYQISAGAVLESAGLAKSAPHALPVERLRTLLSGRIVLLGGTFAAGRDRYPTPVGMLSGVEILGHAILTAHAGGISEMGTAPLIVLDLVLGIGLVMLGLVYPRTAFTLNVTLMVLMIPVSAMLFRSFAFFADTMPVQVSVLLHHLLHPLIGPRLRPKKKDA